MTIVGILNKKYKSKDGTYPVVIRVINVLEQRHRPTGYRVLESQWKDGQVVKHPDAQIINSILADEIAKARRYAADCQRVGAPVDLSLIFSDVKSHSFTQYLKQRATQHKDSNELAMHFKAARFGREFDACFGREIFFSDMTPKNLRVYDEWLKGKGNGANTRAKKFEFLGKYYTNALAEKLAFGDNPFPLYKIATTPVKKHKLSREQVAAMEACESEPLARDMWLFSYYCKGVRFENVLTAKKAGVVNGRVHFIGVKGGKHISVKLHPKLEAIIDRYRENATDTIFGRINDAETLTASQYRSRVGGENVIVNRALKTIGALIELPVPLTFHMARHTVAMHLKLNNTSIHVIKDALGHSNIKTTELYLKDLDDEAIDGEMGRLYETGKHL